MLPTWDKYRTGRIRQVHALEPGRPRRAQFVVLDRLGDGRTVIPGLWPVPVLVKAECVAGVPATSSNTASDPGR